MNSKNPYLSNEYVQEHFEGLDEEFITNSSTKYFVEKPKKLINKVDSPDLGLSYSMNPYQGCEHGCIYCYARNTHQYWGYSAGLDFERNIIVKKNAPQVLEKQLRNPKWEVRPIMLAGNTDCYQPADRKFQLTKQILEILVKYKHPVSLITKNSLILRDKDLLRKLNKEDLVSVAITLNSLNEEVRRKLEPRTTTGKQRLKVVQELSDLGVPVTVMIAPVIPSINSSEIPEIVKQAALAGATRVGYIIVRLNGTVGDIFTDWVNKSFPDRAEKVLNQVKSCHGGQLNDSRYGVRMKGEGKIAASIKNLFMVARAKHFNKVDTRELNCNAFLRTNKGQMQLDL